MRDYNGEDFPFPPPLRVARFVGMVILGVLAAAAFALVFGWLVMLLWNWLMPAIFGLGVITYWQAFGIVVLAKLVFGAVGGGRGHGRQWHGSRRDWKHWDWGGRGGRFSGPERWRYWREFWEQEGRQAFDRFLERRQAGGQEKPQGPGGPHEPDRPAGPAGSGA
jgi:hypothetical protein